MNRKIIPYYAGDIYSSIVIGHLSIKQWVEANKNTKPHIKDILYKVRAASRDGDKKLKQQLKTKLYYITPSVYIEKGFKRRYDNIVKFTGYMQVDIDGLKSVPDAINLRRYLFDMYDTIICSYLSPSGLGVKCIMRIPVVEDVEEYKDYHAAVEEELLNQTNNFDHATFNPVLPLFISEDSNLLYRDNAAIWDIKKDRTVHYEHLNIQESDFGRNMMDFEKSLKTIEQFKTKIDSIINDDGHPRLRSACLVLGSRAGAEYIDIQQAFELAEYCIDTNGYLSKKRNTYLKTAQWAIREGYSHPQFF